MANETALPTRSSGGDGRHADLRTGERERPRHTAQALAHSTDSETPGSGHSVIGNGGSCGASIVRAFINDPTTPPATDGTTTLGITYVTGATAHSVALTPAPETTE